MWTFKYKPIKKVVEARARYQGADVLLTVSDRWTKLSMNGGVMIMPSLFDEFMVELADAGKKARSILESQ